MHNGSQLPLSSGMQRPCLLSRVTTQHKRAKLSLQVRPYDADAITRIQMPPPPLPVSWGRTVQPYVPPHACVRPMPADAAEPDSAAAFGRTYQARCVSAQSPLQLVCCGGNSLTPAMQLFSSGNRLARIRVQAVLVQPGWAGTSAAADAGDAQLAALARVPMEQLCPVGFVFLWAEKVCSEADLLELSDVQLNKCCYGKT